MLPNYEVTSGSGNTRLESKVTGHEGCKVYVLHDSQCYKTKAKILLAERSTCKERILRLSFQLI